MSGPIVRKYGFPNFEKIFGERPLVHGVDDAVIEESPKPDAPVAPSAAVEPEPKPTAVGRSDPRS